MESSNGSGPMAVSSRFLSTTTLPARDRLPVWREVFGQTMVRLDIEPVKDTSFHAEGTLLVLPGAAFASVATTPVHVSRTRKLIAEDMADMAFMVIADVPLLVAQIGREQLLDAGDAIFLRGSEHCTIQSRDRAKFTNISVPISDLTARRANCHDLSLTVVNRQSDLLGLLSDYVHLLQAGQKPLSGALGGIAAGHIGDLMAAMLGSTPDGDPQHRERGGVRSGRLRAIKADIGRHLCDPGLSIDVVALRHRISPRYVRKLFQEEQTTFSDFVLSLRLEQSRRMLCGSTHAFATIASVAHSAGFNDLSYFNRTFRRRYGITPTGYRNGVQ